MPINGDLLGYQRRSLPIGEIRMGYSVEVPGKKGRQPMRSDTWRFTTGSEQAALVIASKYEGTVAPWARRKGRLEVITSRTALDVFVPPRGEAVDTSMELWDGPRRKRQCDGVMMMFPERRPCMCPLPGDPSDPGQVLAARAERERLAGLRPPQACKLLTRFALTIPDLPGLLGIWRLNTGSVNAAVETADSGEAMAIAREGGVYVPAVLRIEWRPRALDGSLCQVPVLMLGQSMRDLASGVLPAGPAGLLAQLQGAPASERPRAIQNVPRAETAHAVPPPGDHDLSTAMREGGHDALDGLNGVRAPDDMPRPGQDALGDTNPRITGPGLPELDDDQRYQMAQAIADECATASVTSARFTELWALARDRGIDDEYVYLTEDRDNGPCDPLGERLDDLWREKAKGAGG